VRTSFLRALYIRYFFKLLRKRLTHVHLPISETICPGQSKILSENYIGKDHNVKMTTLSCAQNASIVEPRRLSERQTTTTPLNVCGAKCNVFEVVYSIISLKRSTGNTNCFLPAGGGPDPNDCHVITDALKFEAQNTGMNLSMSPVATISVPVG